MHDEVQEVIKERMGGRRGGMRRESRQKRVQSILPYIYPHSCPPRECSNTTREHTEEPDSQRYTHVGVDNERRRSTVAVERYV